MALGSDDDADGPVEQGEPDIVGAEKKPDRELKPGEVSLD